MNRELIRLHLGCGENYLGGYINVDLSQDNQPLMRAKADICADIRELHYDDNSIDEIRSHHLLEHFSRQEALGLLLQWRRWLKPGGILHVETPDFESAVRTFIYASRVQRFKIARHIFGSQEAEWAFHKDFWGKEKWRYVLSMLGFDNIRCVSHRILTRRTRHIPVCGGIAIRIARAFPFLASALGFDTLHNVVAIAKKGAGAIDEQRCVDEILSLSLIGDEKEILNIWKREIRTR